MKHGLTLSTNHFTLLIEVSSCPGWLGLRAVMDKMGWIVCRGGFHQGIGKERQDGEGQAMAAQDGRQVWCQTCYEDIHHIAILLHKVHIFCHQLHVFLPGLFPMQVHLQPILINIHHQKEHKQGQQIIDMISSPDNYTQGLMVSSKHSTRE